MSFECDFWADVNFGRGPVEVRCTLRGDHITHICTVVLAKTDSNPSQQNIFDQESDSQDLHVL
jgi:hypothetical protein